MTIEWRWLIVAMLFAPWATTLSLRVSALENGCVHLLHRIIYT